MNVLLSYVRLRVLDNSSHATIQRVGLNALGLSVKPITYHGPFTILLLFSCAWSIDMSVDRLDDL